MLSLKDEGYNPDVLSCLANLSNDEVFTPPEIANKMLDLLPQEIFRDPTTTFLDPACKSGVFLREIARRLIVGLQPKIPDLQERLDHIFHKQLFGIAITQLTSLLARRTLYCSKYPKGRYSVSKFENAEGNIFFRTTQHAWKDGRCEYCGASEREYARDASLETHAYEFIHVKDPQEIFKMDRPFTVIIGNPPYQLNDGGGTGSSARPIYQDFVMAAWKLNPRFVTMITPSRWFTGGRKELDEFREKMFSNRHLSVLCDYVDSNDCFAGVGIKGGVSYFLWERDYQGDCLITTHLKGESVTVRRPLIEKGTDVFIRYHEAVSIFEKVRCKKEPTFEKLVSSRRPFGLDSKFADFLNRKPKAGETAILANKTVGCLKDRSVIPQNRNWVDKYKVFITFAYGAGEDFPHQILNKPIFGDKNTCCTETYLVIGPFKTKAETENVISYIKTRFFRFLVMLLKSTQNGTRQVYSLVPLQDFSKAWSDEELYEKYGLTEEERAFIESMIREMR